MKLQRHFTLMLMFCLLGLWIIPIDQTVAEKGSPDEIEKKGLIDFDFPDAPDATIEVNLTEKLISLLTKSMKTSSEEEEIAKMLTGIYVRSYDRGDVDEDKMVQYYQEKLKKDKWEVLVKVNDSDEFVEISLFIHEDVAYGVFAIIMPEKPEEIIFVNIVGSLASERISELLENIMKIGMAELDIFDTLKSKVEVEVNPIGNINSKDLIAVKVENPPKIDGQLNDKCWKTAPQADNFTHITTQKPVKDQTTVKMVYTDKAIYLAWYNLDSEPKKIRFSTKKDHVPFVNEDVVCFSIDTMHTHNSNMRTKFMANPLGKKYVQFADRTLNTSELTDRWNAAAKIVDDGWVVEMEIPWNMLGRPKTTKPVQMGINFNRKQQRTGEDSWWSNVGVEKQYSNDGNWLKVLPP